MKNKKSIILIVVGVLTLLIAVVGATYAYFTASGSVGTKADVSVTTYTSDLLTFTTGDAIAIYADQSNFADGLGNKSGATFAKAHLLANNKTNEAIANYYVYFYIPDNSFVYTQEDNTAELLLQVTDPDGTEIISIDGLEYKTVTDGKGNEINGFDITTKLGMLTIVNNHEIVATPEIQETWNINVVFVNLSSNQSENMGKDFRGQLIITKDNYDDYTPAMVHTISTSIENSNLTVSVNASEGTEGISKYYYAIKENNAIAMNTSKVTRLSNTLVVNDLEYIESDSSSYTFTNINSNSNYEIYTYVVDKKKTTSNIYNSKVNNESVVLPQITSVEVKDKTSTSLTISVTATAGTNELNKYYYSIDNGNTYVESTSTTYTFNNLNVGENYNIKIKVSDTNDNQSYEFELNEKTILITLANWVKSKYTGTQGENNLYYHNDTLENGAGDNSYRYTGANPNNYVCFGSDTDVCPDDNLYRIIGVFGDKVKLIKYDYATKNLLGEDGDYSDTSNILSNTYKGSLSSLSTYYWNNANALETLEKTEYYNSWEYSSLNKVNLNKKFLENIGDKWGNMISNYLWIVSGNTKELIRYSTLSALYKNEILNPSEQVEVNYEAKIGLMYVSDYAFAFDSSLWEYSVNNFANLEDNWVYMGLNEYTITRSASNTYLAFYICDDKHVSNYYVNTDVDSAPMGIRPVFYLNSSVKYIFGIGTKSDPIRLS